MTTIELITHSTFILMIIQILNTVSKQIGNNLTFINSASALWNELPEHYSQLDGHRIYQLANEIVDHKQSNCNFEIYYYKLKGLWDELDAIERTQSNNRPRIMNMVTGETSNSGDSIPSQSTPLKPASHSAPSEALVYARMDKLQNQLNQVLMTMQTNQGDTPGTSMPHVAGILSFDPKAKVPLKLVDLLLIAKKLLESKNYITWKISMLIALSAKNKLKLVNGEYEEPYTSSDLRAYWERANDMLISWILNTVSKQIGNNKTIIQNIKQHLNDKFSIKDLGHQHYYLGIKFLRNGTGLAMSQTKYALELVGHAGLLDTKPLTIPLDPTVKLTMKGEPITDPSIYKTLVGKLLYLTITRPDLSFSTQALSQFL
nr:retrovirus-related Pol polyprotein from transposon TNT 1-94 [Tanacetum cinerariifolium]